MQKARALFKKQKASTLAADHIKDHCGGKSLVIPNDTRWNSTYDGVRHLKKTTDASEDNCNKLMDLLGIRKFIEDDLTFFGEYVQVYCHFANVLDLFQGDQDMHVGALLPVLSGLMTKLEEESLKVTICAPLAKALVGGIKKRFEEEFSNDSLYIAAAVHPRFKCLWIVDPQQRAEVWELVRGALHGLQTPDENANELAPEPRATQPPHQGASIVSTLDALVPLGSQADTDDGTSLDLYMKQPTTQDLSVLDNFPLIKKLFIQKNTCLPSSASAERLFSSGKHAFGQLRHKLTDENFEMKLLLKVNSKYWR